MTVLRVETDCQAALATLASAVSSCTQCALCDGRTQTVFGDGPATAKVMVIGEAPGQQEDEQGLPFVGRSGQLFTAMLADAGFYRASRVGLQAANVYIANIAKCRPPNNRPPQMHEIAACQPYLEEQIRLIQPQFMLLAGATAVKAILGPTLAKTGITQLRGQWFATPYRGKTALPIMAMPLYHPAYLLRNPVVKPGSPKALMAHDLKTAREALEG